MNSFTKVKSNTKLDKSNVLSPLSKKRKTNKNKTKQRQQKAKQSRNKNKIKKTTTKQTKQNKKICQ